jgi:hypothetical protein
VLVVEEIERHANGDFRQIFPRQINARQTHQDSVLSRIKERRRRIKELAMSGADGNSA